MARSVEDAACALQAVVDITQALVLLLGENDLVRASSRLAGDGDPGGWYASWLPSLHAASTQAGRVGALQPGVDPATVTVLAVCLVAAAENSALQTACGHVCTPTAVQLTRAWQALLRAVAFPGSAAGISPGGPRDPESRPASPGLGDPPPPAPSL